MDGTQFDLLTRSIAQRLSRRLTFKALTAGLAAGALSQVDVEPAEAARCQSLGKSCKKRRGKPRPKCCAGSVCRGNRCQCKPGRQKCGNKCITKKQCCRNNDCPNNQRCDKKTNKCGCGKNQKRCQGRCIPKSLCCTNADCPSNRVCTDQGQCVVQTCDVNADCRNGDCACGANQHAGVCVAPTFSQTFKDNLDGWFSVGEEGDQPVEDSMSLENGHAHIIPGNTYLTPAEPTAFSRLGGYSSVFPDGGFDVAIDVQLDTSDEEPNSGFQYTVGATNPSNGCLTRRDFVFAVGTNNDASQYCVKFSNNANTDGQINPCSGDHVELTEEPSGWYTFVHKFRNEGGILAVTMEVLNPSGKVVGSGVRKNDTDTIGEFAGGHRHAWFPLITKIDGINIRNSRRRSL